MVLDFLVFAPSNSLVTKIKNLDRHVVKNWTPIEIQLDLDSSIFTLKNLLGTKLQINGTLGAKLIIQLKFNWIFSEFWLLKGSRNILIFFPTILSSHHLFQLQI